MIMEILRGLRKMACCGGGGITKHRTCFQETGVHVLCETIINSELFLLTESFDVMLC